MKIIGLVNKDSGPGFHRIMQPLLMMSNTDAYITNYITEEVIAERKPDIIYYNRFVHDDVFKNREKYGYKIAVDVDDYWHLDVHHIAYQQYKDNKVADLQIKHLRQADVITTTHERLADEISQYNRNVYITPNAIPKNKYFEFQPVFSPVARLFYQGSITHEKDLLMLKNPLKRVKNQKIIAGYTKHPVWDKMVHGFDIKLPGVSVFEYYKHYAHADICLVPLLPTRFNSFKSNLKVLEAAAAGCPAIVSHVDPYLNMPVHYVHKQTDWNKHINALSKKGAWFEAGKELQQWCEKNYNFDKINLIRLTEFKKLLK